MIDALQTPTRSSPEPHMPRARDRSIRDESPSTLGLTIDGLLAPLSALAEPREQLRAFRRTGKVDELERLVTAMGVGDQKALHALHRACESRMRTCSLSIVRRLEVAEEVVSSSFIQAWHGASLFDRTRGPVIAWLLMITRSRSLDALRRDASRAAHEGPEDEDFDDAVQPACAGPEALLECSQRTRALLALLKTLSRPQREAIGLAFMHGMTYDEVARHTGHALGTTKSHINRGLALLRDRCIASALAP